MDIRQLDYDEYKWPCMRPGALITRRYPFIRRTASRSSVLTDMPIQTMTRRNIICGLKWVKCWTGKPDETGIEKYTGGRNMQIGSSNNTEAVKEQYKTSNGLDTRISFHDKYSTNKLGYGNWIVSNYQISAGMKVLELGCGSRREQDDKQRRLYRAHAGFAHRKQEDVQECPGIRRHRRR